MLKMENKLNNELFDQVPFGIYVVNIKNYEIIFINKQFIEWNGGSIGNTCYKSIYNYDKPCSFCKIKQLSDINDSPLDIVCSFENFNESNDMWFQFQEKLLTLDDNEIVKYSIVVNISHLKETQNRLAEAHAKMAILNRELRRLSITDQLTQVFNRVKLDETFDFEIQKNLRYNRPLSILMIDIDFFKKVNDEHGHQTGDVVLRTIAAILKKCSRNTDTIGRWGGEEFIIICPETDMNGCVQLSENIRNTIKATPFEKAGHKTVSIGVTEFKKNDTAASMIARADEALYNAKNNGRDRVEKK